MTDERFAGQGFVYYEVKISPDGSLHVLNGYSDGEKTPTLIEPRVVLAATGKILFDLWHTYQNYHLDFCDNGNAVLNVQNNHSRRTRVVDINFRDSEFSFRDEPGVHRPLSKLEEFISLLDVK
ncbi:MAG: hypothetical protein ABJB66_11310 [Gemmatimonadaceae bacterium]